MEDNKKDIENIINDHNNKTEDKDKEEALKKRLRDNQTYARDMQRRFSNVKNQIKTLVESGDMGKDVAKDLLNSLEKTTIQIPEDLKQFFDKEVQKKIVKIFSQSLLIEVE